MLKQRRVEMKAKNLTCVLVLMAAVFFILSGNTALAVSPDLTKIYVVNSGSANISVLEF